jgi:hypothetical protein
MNKNKIYDMVTSIDYYYNGFYNAWIRMNNDIEKNLKPKKHIAIREMADGNVIPFGEGHFTKKGLKILLVKRHPEYNRDLGYFIDNGGVEVHFWRGVNNFSLKRKTLIDLLQDLESLAKTKIKLV